MESLYRKGIRYALSIRNNTNNEIVYLESSRVPLFIQIKKRQLQFWKTLQTSLNDTPGNPLKQMIEKAELVNSKYISYCKNLHNLHKTPTNCQKNLSDTFCNEIQSKIRTKATANTDFKLGAYLKVNPALKGKECRFLYEPDRVIISRYRTGSHNLSIETGRMSNPIIPRDERLCTCDTEIQTLEHCLLRCPL